MLRAPLAPSLAPVPCNPAPLHRGTPQAAKRQEAVDGTSGSSSSSATVSSTRTTRRVRAAPKDPKLQVQLRRRAISLQPQQLFVLSDEQQRAVNAVVAGHNVFLTGCAGTGKSVTINAIKDELVKRYRSEEAFDRHVAVTAMTGLAATIVDGVTLHSLLKLRKLETHGDWQRMTEDKEVLALLFSLEVLLLDEAGMMSAELLQALDAGLTLARKHAAKAAVADEELSEAEMAAHMAKYDKPFGGLQLILSGDFFQLPPIERKALYQSFLPASPSHQVPHSAALKPNQRPFRNRGFLFQAPAFAYGNFQLIELTKVFRQEEQAFVDLLNAVRCGSYAECEAALRILSSELARPLDESDGIKATMLFATNDMVRGRNEAELAHLHGMKATYTAVDDVVVTHLPPPSIYRPLEAEGLLSPVAFQDLVHRLTEHPEHQYSEIEALPRAASTRARVLYTQWVSLAGDYVRKLGGGPGGLFLECQAGPDVHIKEEAQVMLVRNMDDELINGSRGVVVRFEEMDAATIGQCIAMAGAMDINCEKQMRKWLDKNWKVPVVRFVNGREAPMRPSVFTATVPGYGVCVRVQMPLKLAWAITVHKSQGMTLDKVCINVNGFFGSGMLYTALSRARSRKGLQLLGTHSRKIDGRVMQWWEAHRRGMRYTNTERQPADSPWCWEDSVQQLLVAGHNAEARAWFEQGSAWEPPQEGWGVAGEAAASGIANGVRAGGPAAQPPRSQAPLPQAAAPAEGARREVTPARSEAAAGLLGGRASASGAAAEAPRAAPRAAGGAPARAPPQPSSPPSPQAAYSPDTPPRKPISVQLAEGLKADSGTGIPGIGRSVVALSTFYQGLAAVAQVQQRSPLPQPGPAAGDVRQLSTTTSSSSSSSSSSSGRAPVSVTVTPAHEAPAALGPRGVAAAAAAAAVPARAAAAPAVTHEARSAAAPGAPAAQPAAQPAAPAASRAGAGRPAQAAHRSAVQSSMRVGELAGRLKSRMAQGLATVADVDALLSEVAALAGAQEARAAGALVDER